MNIIAAIHELQAFTEASNDERSTMCHHIEALYSLRGYFLNENLEKELIKEIYAQLNDYKDHFEIEHYEEQVTFTGTRLKEK